MKNLKISLMLAVIFTVAFTYSAPFTSAQKVNENSRRFKSFEPPVALDINGDPDIVEIYLTAGITKKRYKNGKPTRAWGYNGGVPGPTIKAKIGDTLIVNFVNNLPEDTTIHWHGLELPANMDGSHISQYAVSPGGSFRYEFKLLRAGTFWYHPHVRTNVQVEKGLYGALVVEDPAQDELLNLPETNHIMVLDDILLDRRNRVVDPFPDDPLENAATQLNGRDGNHLLVNGFVKPNAIINRGETQRIRIVNAANTRFMRISFSGQNVWRIGGDGGLLENPIQIQPIELVDDPDNPGQIISDPDITKGLLLTPGERADIVFTPTGDSPIDLEWHDLPRGRHSTFYRNDGSIGIGDAADDGKRPYQSMMKFYLVGNEIEQYNPPAFLRNIEVIDYQGAQNIPVIFGHTPPNANGDVTFFAQMRNGMPLPFDNVTPNDAPSVAVGETRIWEVNNLTGGIHNFHTHGFHFQHIETEYKDTSDPDNPDKNFIVPAEYLEDKDTFILPARMGPGGGVSRTISRFAVTFDDTGREGQILASGKIPSASRSGGWLFHCHLLEHSSRGMMSFFQVFDNPPLNSKQ